MNTPVGVDTPIAGPMASCATDPSTTPRVAGWIATSMLDWPGRTATTVFLAGCNARCAFCHNPELVTPSSSQDAHAALLTHIKSHREWIDGVVVTGGEPTTDPSLFVLLDSIASLCLPVKLDTNGTRPDILGNLIDSGLIASVALDVKTVPERYDMVTGIPGAAELVTRSIHTILGSGIQHEFRTTMHPASITPDEATRVAQSLSGGERYVLQQFRPDRVLDPQAACDQPFHPDTMHATAAACSEWIPTTVRGA